MLREGEKSTEIYHINFISCTIASEVSGWNWCVCYITAHLEGERNWCVNKVFLGRLMENLGNLSADIVIKHPVRRLRGGSWKLAFATYAIDDFPPSKPLFAFRHAKVDAFVGGKVLQYFFMEICRSSENLWCKHHQRGLINAEGNNERKLSVMNAQRDKLCGIGSRIDLLWFALHNIVALLMRLLLYITESNLSTLTSHVTVDKQSSH